MTPGTPEDSHLAVAPLHFSLPLKHNTKLPPASPLLQMLHLMYF